MQTKTEIPKSVNLEKALQPRHVIGHVKLHLEFLMQL